MLEWVKTELTKNKVVFFLLVVIIVYEMVNFLEDNFILEKIALISKRPDNYFMHDPGNYTCPFLPSYEFDYPKGQHATFFWTEEQKVSIKLIQYNIPFFTLLCGGIYSDKYGGHRVMIVGLVLSSFVMSTFYLFMFDNNFIFLTMLFLRKSSQGLIWAAIFSLAGKLVLSDQKTIFVCVLFAGDDFGELLAYIVSTIVPGWKSISLFSGFQCFVTVIWWWIIIKSSQFPKVRRTVRIPWRDMMTTVPLYALSLLNISCYLFNFIKNTEYENYAKQVLFFKVNQEWKLRFVFCLTSIFSYLFCGFSSDYIISKRYLSATAVRRMFISVCLVTLFCTLVVVKLVRCNRIVVVGCSVILYFVEAVAWSTTETAILDFGQTCSGTVNGIVYMFAFFLKFPFYETLRDLFVSGDSKGNINRWSELFFTLAFLGLAFSLLFICGGKKIEASLNRKHKNIDLDTTVSKSAKVGQQQFLQDSHENIDLDTTVSKSAKVGQQQFRQDSRKNIDLDTTVSKSAQEGQQQFLHDSNPGPSNR